MVKCDKCKSEKVWKYGFDYYINPEGIPSIKIQKFKCKKCGFQWRQKIK